MYVVPSAPKYIFYSEWFSKCAGSAPSTSTIRSGSPGLSFTPSTFFFSPSCSSSLILVHLLFQVVHKVCKFCP